MTLLPLAAQPIGNDRFSSVHFTIGSANYVGDLSPRWQTIPVDGQQRGLHVALGFSQRLNRRWTAMGQLAYSRLRGDDQVTGSRTGTLEQQQAYLRNLHFRNDIVGLEGHLQYDLLPHKGHYTTRRFFRPYLSAGLSFFRHNPQARTPGTLGGIWTDLQPLGTEGQGRSGYAKPYALFQFGVPVGGGINLRISPQWDLGLQASYQFAFTDYLDDVSGKYADWRAFGDNRLALALADRSAEPVGGGGQGRDLSGFPPFSDGSYTTYYGFGHPANVEQNRGSGKKYDGWWNVGVSLRYLLSRNKKPEKLSTLYQVNLPYEQPADRKPSPEFYEYEDRYSVELLGINTPYNELAPSFYQNGILFVTDRPDGRNYAARTHGDLYNLYYAPIVDIFANEITKAIMMTTGEKLRWHFYAASAHAKSQKAIATLYERQDGSPVVKKQQLYLVDVVGENAWQNAQPMPFSTNEHAISQPSWSPDGNALYFVSDMPGGKGGSDIYVSYRINGQWTYPANVGEPVNTAGDEMFPFVHEDGTLYFASNGHKGMGGLDIFEAIPEGKVFGRVANVGYPINSTADDFGLILDDVKRVGFFTSNRSGGKGGNDLYKLNVESINRSRRLTDKATEELFSLIELEIRGKIINKESRQPIPWAVIKLRNLLDDDIKLKRANEEGEFVFAVTNDAMFELGSSIIGYQPIPNQPISTVGLSENKPVEVLIEAEPLSYKFTVKGTIRDEATGKPLANTEVVLLDLDNDTQKTVNTDEEGNYTLSLAQNRDYVIFVSEKGYQPKEYPVSTYNKTASETLIIQLNLKRQE